MEPATTLYSTVLLLGSAQGLFLAIALINVKGGNTIAQRLLALLTLSFAADLGVDFLLESHYLVRIPKAIFVESLTSFLYGPLAYLYVLALTSKEHFRFSSRQWLHFLPFVMAFFLLIPFYNLSNEYLLELIYLDVDIDDRVGVWIIGAVLVELLPLPLIGIYLTLAVRQVARHGRNIRDHYSSIERINLVWLRNLLIALGVLYILYLAGVVFSGFLGEAEQIGEILSLAIVVVIYAMGYMGIRQPVIFSRSAIKSRTAERRFEATDEPSLDPEKKKYQKSALDAEMSSALLQELQRHMADESPYLDNALTLTQLADQLRMSSNYLSQVINEQTGNNFFDYINQYRVDAAKRLLADSPKVEKNILTIAMDAGFNSKSAFYTAFKKHTNQTPTQFRKSLASVPESG